MKFKFNIHLQFTIFKEDFWSSLSEVVRNLELVLDVVPIRDFYL